YLKELLRGEGRGEQVEQTVCSSCQASEPEFRCKDCFGGLLYCQGCIVKKHVENPLHRIERWNGSFFERDTLKRAGLVVQLNHPIGELCLAPKQAWNNDFTVIDVSGVHEVSVMYCECPKRIRRHQQLLRSSWYPATTDEPKTAATFRVLEQYHLLSFESKASAYEFYSSLCRRTDNTGLPVPKDRYDQFLRMMREWRHLKMLKRSGVGHEETMPEDLPDGTCAVICPACPQPERNLPSGWENAKGNRWLYSLFVAIDANFRLKRKKVSSESADPSLGCGLSYFVRDEPFREHVSSHARDSQDKSSCASHKAVNKLNTKFSEGLATTGVGTIDCARHNIKLPCGVGNLNGAERYSIMDYIIFSGLRFTRVKDINFSYDIACQWSKNLWSRVSKLPSYLSFERASRFIRFFVPKFHLPAHIARCQMRFSFNWMPGVGRTDGEAVERGWANINPVATSTKEMGPGHRIDTLDDYFGDWNWKKVIGLGELLKRRLEEAIPASKTHTADLKEFEASLPPGTLQTWRKEMVNWESDPDGNQNPFESRSNDPTLASIRLELAKEEALIPSPASAASDMTASALISSGLDLMEQRRRLRSDREGLGQHATDIQKTVVEQRSTILRNKLDSWIRAQLHYMPGVARLRPLDAPSAAQEDLPEDANLFLPSDLPVDFECDDALKKMEFKLRVGQAYDALAALRQSLQLRSYLLNYKAQNISGQTLTTKAQGLVNKAGKKITWHRDSYTLARTALLVLAERLPDLSIPKDLKILTDNDVHAMTDVMEAQTEGRRRLTWIWRSGDVSQGDDGLQDGIRTEWCKARARALRWTEEVHLLKEEMRRTLQYMLWHARWWEVR
ncbi:hypothetical protein CONPUDRAFT_34829, partial [Coniophora puteana RWD-64-598 SS2]